MRPRGQHRRDMDADGVAAMTILIVGISTRAVAQSATRAGYHVWTVDFFGDLDQRRCCHNVSLRRDVGVPFSAQALFRAAAQGGAPPADGVVYLANLENHPDVIAAFAARWPVLGNGPATVAVVRDWETLAAAVARLGFRVPRTLEPGKARPDGRWLSKRRRGGGGAGIREWHGEATRTDRLIQEHVNGLPSSVAFAADGRHAVVLGVSEQLIGRREFGASGFRYCGNIFPLDTTQNIPAIAARLQVLVGGLADAFGLVGVGGADFILADEEPVILEVNPRYTGSMELIERATGASIFETHLRATEGALPDPPPVRVAGGYWGKAIVFARQAVIMGDPEPWLQRGICDVPHAGDRIEAGQPICTVIAHGKTREACLAGLTTRAQEVYHELDG